MPTVITRYVDGAASGADDGTSIGDAYPSFNAAISDIVSDYADFTSSDVQVDLLCTGTIDSTGGPVFSSTCDATRFLRIKPYQAGDKNLTGVWDPSTYCVIRNASNNNNMLQIGADARVEIEDLQLGNNKPGATSFGRIFNRNGTGTLIVRRCWMKQMTTVDSSPSGNDKDAMVMVNAAFTLEIYDSIIEGFLDGIRINTSSCDPKVVNTLFIDNDQHVYNISGSSPSLKNCIFKGAITADQAGSGTLGGTSNYNATDDASAPTNFGANSLSNQTISLTSSSDYRLNATDTALHSSGIGTTDGDVQSTDKIGTARGSSTASMGPFEYSASSPSNPLNPFGGMINSLGIGLIQ